MADKEKLQEEKVLLFMTKWLKVEEQDLNLDLKVVS